MGGLYSGKESFVQYEESFVQYKESFVQYEESFVQYKESFVQHEESFVQYKESVVQHEECFVWPLWATVPVPTIGIKQGRVKQHMDPGGCSSVSKVTPPVSIKSLRKGIKLAKS